MGSFPKDCSLGQDENSESPRLVNIFIHIIFLICPIHSNVKHYSNSYRVLCLEAHVHDCLSDLRPMGWGQEPHLGMEVKTGTAASEIFQGGF